MNQILIDRFKDYVNNNYSVHNIKVTDICSNLHCSRSYLHEMLIYNYGYSIMKYVEYFRILKSIELICKGERNVYIRVGYNSPSVFSRSFLRITGFNARCFFPYQDIDHKSIIKTVLNVETEDPKEAIETIIKDVSERSMLENGKLKKKSTQKITI
jgi:AraC-like DNA-binding protein